MRGELNMSRENGSLVGGLLTQQIKGSVNLEKLSALLRKTNIRARMCKKERINNKALRYVPASVSTFHVKRRPFKLLCSIKHGKPRSYVKLSSPFLFLPSRDA